MDKTYLVQNQLVEFSLLLLKLITEREHEIEMFNPKEFWTLSVKFNDNNKNKLLASIYQYNGLKIEKFSFKNKTEINKAIDDVSSKKFSN